MSTLAPTDQNMFGTIARLPEQSPADKKRASKHEERMKAFRGDLEKPLKIQDDQTPDFNTLDNRCGPVVLKGVSFLFGQALDINVKMDAAVDTEDEADLDDPTAVPDIDPKQQYLEQALGDMDDFMTLLSKGAMNGGIYGECFLQLMEPDPASGQKFPRVVVLDPCNVWVETDPEDCEQVLAFNVQYKIDSHGDPRGQNLIKRKRISRVSSQGSCGCCANCTGPGCGCCAGCQPVTGDALGTTWLIQCYTQSGKQNASDMWQTDGPAITWPYRFPPICYCQNMPEPNEYWGCPDLTDDLIQMNKHLNLVQSNIAKLLWFYSAPYLFIDQPDLGNLKITPGMAIGIGQGVHVEAVHATGDIASARAFAADLRSDMDELSRVPAVALGRLVDLPKGNLSGVALALLFQPIVEKTNIKRRLYGRMIRDLCQRILALGGYGDGEDTPVEIHWPEILPDDELQHLQALQIKQALGWSDETLITEAGGDYREEQLRKQREAKAETDNFNAGQGTAPQANAFGKAPLPPEMQQNQQNPPPAFQAQQAKLTGGNQDGSSQ